MGKYLNMNIIIICSSVSFRFLKIDKNFVYLKIVAGPASQENSIVIGVSGSSTYHKVDTIINVEFWSIFNEDNCFTIEHIQYISAFLSRLPRRQSMLLEDEGITDELNDQYDMYIEGDERSNVVETDHALILEDIIDEFQLLDMKEKFSSDLKIDFQGTSLKVLDRFDVNWTQTFDVDGVFLIIENDQISEILKCPLTLISSPIFAKRRDINTFKNTFLEVFPISECFQMIKIGFLKLEFGNFDVFLCYGIHHDEIDERIKILMKKINHINFVKDVLNLVKEFPCDHVPDHREFCQSQEFRAQRQSSMPISGVKEDQISSELLNCFSILFKTIFLRKLNIPCVQFKFYLRMIGTKHILTSETLEGVATNIEKINGSVDILKLSDDCVAIDFCIQTVPFDTEERIQVNCFLN